MAIPLLQRSALIRGWSSGKAGACCLTASCPVGQLCQLIGAEGLAHAREDRLLLAPEVFLDLQHECAFPLAEAEAIRGEAAHLGQQLVELLVLAHAVGEGVVACALERSSERREDDLLLHRLVGGELLNDAQEQASGLRRVVRGVELLDEPSIDWWSRSSSSMASIWSVIG